MPCSIAAKVLLVDDDRIDLEHYAAVLRNQGYEVEACGSYAEGLRRLESGAFDFVIVSQGGPAFEGRSVLERAREAGRDMPILVLTHCVDVKKCLEAMDLGAVDYLEKSVRPDDLVWTVETYLRSRPYHPTCCGDRGKRVWNRFGFREADYYAIGVTSVYQERE